jgi:hypothetical protein
VAKALEKEAPNGIEKFFEIIFKVGIEYCSHQSIGIDHNAFLLFRKVSRSQLFVVWLDEVASNVLAD